MVIPNIVLFFVNLSILENLVTYPVQDHQKGLDYDEFILSKIRELEITFEPMDDKNGATFSLKLDPGALYDEVLRELGASLGTEPVNLELFKCHQDKNMPRTPHPRPVDFTP